MLAPTQRIVLDAVKECADLTFESERAGAPPPPLRLAILGPDGAGKSILLNAIARNLRAKIGDRGACVVADQAWGVSSRNVGCGARAVASLFRTTGDRRPLPPEGAFVRFLQDVLQKSRLLIIGAIITVESQKLAAAPVRLE